MSTVIAIAMGLIVGYIIGVGLGAITAFVFGLKDAARFVAIGCGLLTETR